MSKNTTLDPKAEIVAGMIVRAPGLPKRTIVAGAKPGTWGVFNPTGATVQVTNADVINAHADGVLEVVRVLACAAERKHTAAQEKARRANRKAHVVAHIERVTAAKAEPKAPSKAVERMTKAELLALVRELADA